MAEIINNLFKKITAPSLLGSEYGENINAQFNNINKNFGALANREFVQGPMGQGVNVVEIKFKESELTLTAQSPDIKISETLKNSIKTAFETYNPDNQDWYKDITCSAYLDSDEKLHSIYPIIYFEAVKDITGDIKDGITKTNFQSLQFDYKESDVLYLTTYNQNLPSIEYNYDVGDYCWVLNGELTEIKAQGPQGKNGKDADSFDALIVNQKPISENSNLHEITHIYVDGVLRELTPKKITTADDLLWVREGKSAWINDNIDKIFITTGPSKTDTTKTINYFGKIIKQPKIINSGDIASPFLASSQNTPSGVSPSRPTMPEDPAELIREYIYCMKLDQETVFNMSVMAQTSAGTLYNELIGTYPDTQEGSTQALFLRDSESKMPKGQAYTLHNSGNSLVIGRVDDYEKCGRNPGNEVSFEPTNTLITIKGSSEPKTILDSVLNVNATTQLNGELEVKGGQKTTLGGELEVNGATTLNNNLEVTNGKPTTLGGALTVAGATQLNNDLGVGSENTKTIITPSDFKNYFIKKNNIPPAYLGVYWSNDEDHDDHYLYSIPENVLVINFPAYISYVIAKFDEYTTDTCIHYIGRNFDFFVKKVDTNGLYKVYGDIEIGNATFDVKTITEGGPTTTSKTVNLGWFSLDCYFEETSNVVTIPYCNILNYGINYVTMAPELGLMKIDSPNDSNYGFGVGVSNFISPNDLIIAQLTEQGDNPHYAVCGGIGIYKKNSFLSNPYLAKLPYIETSGTKSSKSSTLTASNQTEIGSSQDAVVDSGSATTETPIVPTPPPTPGSDPERVDDRRIYQATLPYWATCLSSYFPKGMPAANDSE